MKKLLLLGLIAAILIAGCIKQEPEKPEETLTVSELLEESEYDTEVEVFGQVSLLGELFCPCFELTSSGKKITVWYGLMVEDDETERPSVNVSEIKNGDWVIVTGELKTAGKYRTLNDFWAIKIEKSKFSVEYSSVEECQSACFKAGYDTGVCKQTTEKTTIDVDLGSCVIEGSENCENKGQCNCYCYTKASELELACINSGGTVATGTCCESVDDFPNNCLIGACGCAPKYSHQIKTCNCGEGKCWDGTACVQQTQTEDVACTSPTGGSMMLSEARQIAVSSECGERLKENYICNPDTGTWWLDLDIEKQGCNPACVVNIDTKQTEINWRCTGLII